MAVLWGESLHVYVMVFNSLSGRVTVAIIFYYDDKQQFFVILFVSWLDITRLNCQLLVVRHYCRYFTFLAI